MEKYKSLIIGLILVVGFSVLIYSVSRVEKAVNISIESPEITIDSPDIEFGRSIQNETFMLNAQRANVASISMTEDDDVVAYSGDIVATLSVDDVVSFDPLASISGTGLVSGKPYYVSVASNSGFEVSETKGGSSIDITADSTDGTKFYEEITTIPLKTVDFRHLTIWLDAENSPSVSLKFVGSTSDAEPAWYEPQSSSGSAIYENIGIYDLEDAALIPGDTGITFAGTDDQRMFTVNTDEIAWISWKSSKYGSGSITFKATLGD